jgi:tetratricopeptide (TPR) repeat protein
MSSLEGNLEVVFQLAAWQLLSGEQEAYEETCRLSIAEYAASENARELYLVARMCSLSSRSSIEPQKLVAIASRAAELDPNAWHAHALGLSLLRAGKYEQAIREFERSLAESWLDTANWLGLAIANHAAGRHTEAGEFLQMARQSAQQQLIDLGSRSTISSHDRIACQLLLREAEKLIGK